MATKPKYIRIPFAASGDKKPIPDDATGTGEVSYAEGFGFDYERDPTSDPQAKRIPRDATNQIYNDQTLNIQQYQLYGSPWWYGPDDNKGNPVSYSAGARVRYSNGSTETNYVSLIDNNTSVPTNASAWIIDNPAFYSMRDGSRNYGAGSSSTSAIVVNLVPPVAQLIDGLSIKVKIATQNSANVTINLNRTGPKKIFKPTAANGVVPLQGGEMQPNGIYSLTYNSALDNGSGGWFFPSIPQSNSFPSGMVTSFAMPTAPEGWLECDGRELSRTDYASLFAAIGTYWGAGDGSTTFKIPDFRAQFLRGWDHGKNQDEWPNRPFATWQESANLGHGHTANCQPAGKHNHSVWVPSRDAWGVDSQHRWNPGYAFDTVWSSESGEHAHNITVNFSGGKESRPINFAVLFCIKY